MRDFVDGQKRATDRSTDLSQDYSERREEGMNETRTDEDVHDTSYERPHLSSER